MKRWIFTVIFLFFATTAVAQQLNPGGGGGSGGVGVFTGLIVNGPISLTDAAGAGSGAVLSSYALSGGPAAGNGVNGTRANLGANARASFGAQATEQSLASGAVVTIDIGHIRSADGVPVIRDNYGLVQIDNSLTGVTPIVLSNCSETGNIATCTCSSACAQSLPAQVQVNGNTVSAYNGVWNVLNWPSGTSFTFVNPTTGLGAGGGGNVEVSSQLCFEVDEPFPGFGSGPGNAQCALQLPSITSLTQSGSTATVTFSSAHNMATNDTINILNATPPAYDGVWMITVTSPTTVTYSMNTTGLAPATGAGAIGGCNWNAILEASLNNTNFGHNYQIPPNQVFYTVLAGKYTNLSQFGNPGAQPTNVSPSSETSMFLTLKNLNNGTPPCNSGAPFNYFIGGHETVVPLGTGDLGGYSFE